MSPRSLAALLLVSSFVSPIATARAQILFIYDWNNPAGGAYGSQFNWSPSGIPDSSGDLARFQLNGSYDVQVNADYTVGSLAVRQNTDATLVFQPPSTFTPRKIYKAGDFTIDPTAGGNANIAFRDGDVRVTGDTLVGAASSVGDAKLHPRCQSP